MRRLILVLLAFACATPAHAQQSVMINEPAGQCYQDLKTHLPEAIRWNDEQMMVTSRPLVTTLSGGNVEVIARIFPEHGLDKKTKQRVEMCKLMLYISAREYSTSWNARNSSWLLRNANLMKAKIEGAIKAREKAREEKLPK
jgi:hypothetical protein